MKNHLSGGPGKPSVPFFKATVAGFGGKVDGNEQQLVFPGTIFFGGGSGSFLFFQNDFGLTQGCAAIELT